MIVSRGSVGEAAGAARLDWLALGKADWRGRLAVKVSFVGALFFLLKPFIARTKDKHTPRYFGFFRREINSL